MRLRKPLFALLTASALLGGTAMLAVACMTAMPGRSPKTTERHSDPSRKAQNDTGLSFRLERHVRTLGGDIGERNAFAHYDELLRTQFYIENALEKAGYEPRLQEFQIQGRPVRNIEARLTGSPSRREVVIVGAHYDSAANTPAANDNGSGVAALLELARLMRDDASDVEVRFVFFVNEEPPYFHTEDMGSARYAKRSLEQNENIIAMLSLETLGYYSDDPFSQKYPPPLSALFPNRGNFVAFVGNWDSRTLTRRCVETFRSAVEFPSQGAALPGSLEGVGWSDHWSFWQIGVPALMVTDTAIFRYPHYHETTDTPDRLDYDALALVVEGLLHVLKSLAVTPEAS